MLTLRRTLLHSFFIGGFVVGGSGVPAFYSLLALLCMFVLLLLYIAIINSVIFSAFALHNSSLDSDYVRCVVLLKSKTTFI